MSLIKTEGSSTSDYLSAKKNDKLDDVISKLKGRIGVVDYSNMFEANSVSVQNKHLIEEEEKMEANHSASRQPNTENTTLVPNLVDDHSLFNKSYLMWENNANICWLDASMSLLAHNHTLQQLISKASLAQIGKIITFYNEAMAVLNDRISPDTSEVRILKAKELLKTVQDSTLKYLQPYLKCVEGQPDSAFCSLFNLIAKDKIVKPYFEIEYGWVRSCSKCLAYRTKKDKKVIITLPRVKDFQPESPISLCQCPACKEPDQSMVLVYRSLPQCLLFHFENGAGTGELQSLDFEVEKRQYKVTGVITLEKGVESDMNHFVTWIRDPDSEGWLECNDLNMDIVSFNVISPCINLEDIYLLMYEAKDNFSDIPLVVKGSKLDSEIDSVSEDIPIIDITEEVEENKESLEDQQKDQKENNTKGVSGLSLTLVEKTEVLTCTKSNTECSLPNNEISSLNSNNQIENLAQKRLTNEDVMDDVLACSLVHSKSREGSQFSKLFAESSAFKLTPSITITEAKKNSSSLISKNSLTYGKDIHNDHPKTTDTEESNLKTENSSGVSATNLANDHVAKTLQNVDVEKVSKVNGPAIDVQFSRKKKVKSKVPLFIETQEAENEVKSTVLKDLTSETQNHKVENVLDKTFIHKIPPIPKMNTSSHIFNCSSEEKSSHISKVDKHKCIKSSISLTNSNNVLTSNSKGSHVFLGSTDLKSNSQKQIADTEIKSIVFKDEQLTIESSTKTNDTICVKLRGSKALQSESFKDIEDSFVNGPMVAENVKKPEKAVVSCIKYEPSESTHTESTLTGNDSNLPSELLAQLTDFKRKKANKRQILRPRGISFQQVPTKNTLTDYETSENFPDTLNSSETSAMDTKNRVQIVSSPNLSSSSNNFVETSDESEVASPKKAKCISYSIEKKQILKDVSVSIQRLDNMGILQMQTDRVKKEVLQTMSIKHHEKGIRKQPKLKSTTAEKKPSTSYENSNTIPLTPCFSNADTATELEPNLGDSLKLLTRSKVSPTIVPRRRTKRNTRKLSSTSSSDISSHEIDPSPIEISDKIRPTSSPKAFFDLHPSELTFDLKDQNKLQGTEAPEKVNVSKSKASTKKQFFTSFDIPSKPNSDINILQDSKERPLRSKGVKNKKVLDCRVNLSNGTDAVDSGNLKKSKRGKKIVKLTSNLVSNEDSQDNRIEKSPNLNSGSQANTPIKETAKRCRRPSKKLIEAQMDAGVFRVEELMEKASIKRKSGAIPKTYLGKKKKVDSVDNLSVTDPMIENKVHRLASIQNTVLRLSSPVDTSLKLSSAVLTGELKTNKNDRQKARQRSDLCHLRNNIHDLAGKCSKTCECHKEEVYTQIDVVVDSVVSSVFDFFGIFNKK